MKKRFSGPQIVAKLREADRLIGQGKTIEQVCKEIDVTDVTYYRWRQKYGGMSPDTCLRYEVNLNLFEVITALSLHQMLLRNGLKLLVSRPYL